MSLLSLETQSGLGQVFTQGASHLIPLHIFSNILNEEGRPCSYQVTTWKQMTAIYHLITIRYCIIFFPFLR